MQAFQIMALALLMQGQAVDARIVQNVTVTLERPPAVVRGRLVRIEKDLVRLVVDGSARTIPLERVQSIIVRKRDSVIDGAFVGFLGVGLQGTPKTETIYRRTPASAAAVRRVGIQWRIAC